VNQRNERKTLLDFLFCATAKALPARNAVTPHTSTTAHVIDVIIMSIEPLFQSQEMLPQTKRVQQTDANSCKYLSGAELCMSMVVMLGGLEHCDPGFEPGCCGQVGKVSGTGREQTWRSRLAE
jgi:hypothetical protein